MKRYKKIFVLLGVLLLACLATVIIMKTEEKKEEIKNTDEVILSVSPDTVTTLSWNYSDTALSFHKEGDTWSWDDDSAFPVDGEKMNDLLSCFENFGAAFIIEKVDDFSQYGIEDPVCEITMETEDGTVYTVTLGTYSTMDEERYVSIGDGNVYLVSHDPMEDYEVTVSDLILHDENPSYDTVTEITFSGAENYTARYDETCTDTYCDDDVYFTGLDGETLPLDTSRVYEYLSNIRYLALEDYVSYNVTEEELSDWGLDTPELTVNLEYTWTDEEDEETEYEGTYTISIGRNQEELSEKEKAEEKEEEYEGTVTCYARVGDSQIVYEISETDYEALIAASVNDLRHAEVLSADFYSVTGIDITLEGETYTISTEADEDEEDSTVYLLNGEEIDITALQSGIEALTVTEFTEEASEEKEEIRLLFHLDNEKYPEVEVVLYRVDGESCLAVLDGEPLGFVARSAAVDVIEAVNTLVLN